ncbi:MAG: leucine--tRNA ligase [Deltaproteobacteria bacterium]|nr:leucine--tRNA ligase [Deltaproteobacteria bacterium]
MQDYDHLSIEPKWQSRWSSERAFATAESTGKKFYCLDMFPYPSGDGLHVGHPLGYIATDIYSRFKRMQGYAVLHPMGWDAFGLPAEQHAIATGEHPAKITAKNCKRFREQLETLGLSYDWERELATSDPDYYRWTQWIFLKLFNSYYDAHLRKARPIEELPIPGEIQKQGEGAVALYRNERRLAYYADAMVNWCPALGTVLANEEVINGRSDRGNHEVIRRPMKQWILRITAYADRLIEDLELVDWPESIRLQQRHWIGRREGAEIAFTIQGSSDVIRAFTTRPDTIFGVTFFVISPENPLVDSLTKPEQQAAVTAYREKAARLSDLDRTLENREKTGVFTGSYVLNPVNNKPVPIYVADYVLMTYGTGAVMGVPSHDERDFEFAKKFRLEVRPILVPVGASDAERDACLAGTAAWGGEGKAIIADPTSTLSTKLEGKPIDEAKSLVVAWLEAQEQGRGVVQYKLRDWIFSRQRYWGEPIPIIHWEDGTMTSAREEDLPILLPSIQKYQPTETGESPLASATEWLEVTDPETGKRGRRETNTMPQWAGSCWYFLRFIDPKNAQAAWDRKAVSEWMPVDLYVGGAEHAVLHLLYSRFWHKVLYDLGFLTCPEPFQKLFNQGMLQSDAFRNERGSVIAAADVEVAGDGSAKHRTSGEPLSRFTAKMSKSLRNVVNPDDIIGSHGADTLRLYEMFMGPLDAPKFWNTNGLSGCSRFLKRAWRFVMEGATDEVPFVSSAAEPVEAKRAINQLIRKAGDDLENLRFNTTVSAMRSFLNDREGKPVSRETAEKFVVLLGTFCPHIGEELWERLGNEGLLAKQSWPQVDEAFARDEVVPVVIQVNGKKRGLLEMSATVSDETLRGDVERYLAETDYKVAPNASFVIVRNSETKAPRLVNVVVRPS